jgi:hypothetical protein
MFPPILEMVISLVPRSSSFIDVRYRNRPILRCSALARESIELDCSIEDPVMERANNATAKKMCRTLSYTVSWT